MKHVWLSQLAALGWLTVIWKHGKHMLYLRSASWFVLW